MEGTWSSHRLNLAMQRSKSLTLIGIRLPYLKRSIKGVPSEIHAPIESNANNEEHHALVQQRTTHPPHLASISGPQLPARNQERRKAIQPAARNSVV